ncbi:hybrid sensor histidine kinase/response regulator [Leadbettera azotonutricia]|uniref:histidine kinase n=1 Tax=Leadbettera azotonutricia (strain ATCC BAA-888 / DSM 13862 / ZAS-9) TaxID=545695 RepID=F5YFT0_LEAAZ|nr:response regulator [Leadbettera azotonutricia]AEF82292.1 multi-sensor hybrid histidine kinase [Leadbettera azotonutricia ZAS-9]
MYPLKATKTNRIAVQLVFVFSAFFLMILVSYFFVRNILEKQIDVAAAGTLKTAELRLYSTLQKSELILTEASYLIRKRLFSGQKEDIQSFLREYVEWIGESEDCENCTFEFVDLYGCFRDQFASGSGWEFPDSYVPQERPWYTAARDNPREIAVTALYTNLATGEKVISVSKSLYGSEEEFYGVIAMDLSISGIAEYVENMSIAEGGYGMMLNQDLAFVIHPDPARIGEYLGRFSQDHEKVADILRSGEIKTAAMQILDRENKIMATYYKQLFNGWYVGLATPLKSYYEGLRHMSIVLSAQGIILVSFLSYLLVRLNREKIKSEMENRSKSAFLAKMSHEIRTPMNSILGMSELIMRKDIPGNIYEYISIINQAGNSLLAIINDILDLSKIESGQMKPESKAYYFSSLINDVVNMIGIRFTDRPVDFFVDIDSAIPAQLFGDEARIRQILFNLLNNAAKYTKEGFVALSVKSTITGKEKLELEFAVSDSGIGIKEEDQKNLFNEFARMNLSQNQGIEGTGLGLPIALNLCKAMEGDITVESSYGGGSTFIARIVQGFTDPKKTAALERPIAKGVLILEERPRFYRFLNAALEGLGVSPRRAENLDIFTEELEKGAYDFAFVSSKHAADSVAAMGENPSPPHLVIMVEKGEGTAYRDINCILMPVYSITMANVLNGTSAGGFLPQDHHGVEFTAPSIRVLIVDDISTNLWVAKELMAAYGMDIDTCLSGSQAVEMIKNSHYDLVFLDHMMPGMDGLEVAAEIRAMGKTDEYYRKLPLVMLTANALAGQRELFLKSGADDFLAKPIETKKLNAILEKWIPREKRINSIAEEARHPGEKSPPLPSIPGLDQIRGMHNSGDDPAIYLDILSSFIQDGEDKAAELAEAAEKGDLRLYAILVHALKGAARSVGALEFGDAAALMEEAARRKDPEAVREKTAPLLEKLKSLLNSIHDALLNEAAQTETAVPGLEELKNALAGMNIEEVNKLLLNYTLMPLDKKTRNRITEIEQFILMFEYDKAVKCIDRLLALTVSNS